MRIEEDIKLDFKDVLIRPKRSALRSRVDVDVNREYKFLHNDYQWLGVPIIAANMDHTGTFAMANVLAKHKLLTAINKFVTTEAWHDFATKSPDLLAYVFVTVGSSKADFKILCTILPMINCTMICLDVANGYSQHFVDALKRIRSKFPDRVIMAGNVVTGEMTEELLLSGADIVKVGIGPGSTCVTRKKTGVGYPQLSAIIECADAAHGLRGHVCADGGCAVPGDVVKAFAAGADFVMLGGMFAGHDECAGEIFTERGSSYKRFYGMSSAEAMNKYAGGVACYRASEGKSVNVPYRGKVENTVLDILGGLRSACTYIGARKLKELSKCTTFVRVTQQLNEVYAEYDVDGQI
ncbi:MAG: GMP reductase [Coxiellaceae bacterium]|jgi:GMP reductase|nr:GMP reductase [Coxiellaceae bacterium]